MTNRQRIQALQHAAAGVRNQLKLVDNYMAELLTQTDLLAKQLAHPADRTTGELWALFDQAPGDFTRTIIEGLVYQLAAINHRNPKVALDAIGQASTTGVPPDDAWKEIAKHLELEPTETKEKK